MTYRLSAGNEDISVIDKSLNRVLRYSEAHDYAGYTKFDALNSPVLEVLFGWNYFGRLLVTQFVNRCYFHIRPLLLVKKSRNPKGIGNFIKTYCNLYRLTKDERYIERIRYLSEWLLENHSDKEKNYKGMCWGYNFPWQSPGFFAPRYSPNCIVTVFCADGLLEAYRAIGDKRYLEAAREAALFILESLPVLEDDGVKKCIGYVPVDLRWKVININSVAAGFLSRVGQAAGERSLFEEAGKMVQWVVDNRTEYYAWYYTVPASSSGIGHDNYHTGGILDGIFDYMTATGDEKHREVYCRGLDFYRENLFERDGAPRLTSDKKYPFDIHGTAQGVLSFTKASHFNPAELGFALKIARWGIANMQDLDGHFYYRKHSFFTRRECLMRWNNSWMSWALSELLLRLNDVSCL